MNYFEFFWPGGGIAIQDGGGLVRGIIIVDDDLQGLVALQDQGIQAGRYVFFLVPGGNEDGDQRAGL